MGHRCPNCSQAKLYLTIADAAFFPSEIYFLRAKPEQRWAFSASSPILSHVWIVEADYITPRVSLALKFYYYGFYVLLLLNFKSLLSCPQKNKTELFCKFLQRLIGKIKDLIILVVINLKWQDWILLLVFYEQQVS